MWCVNYLKLIQNIFWLFIIYCPALFSRKHRILDASSLLISGSISGWRYILILLLFSSVQLSVCVWLMVDWSKCSNNLFSSILTISNDVSTLFNAIHPISSYIVYWFLLEYARQNPNLLLFYIFRSSLIIQLSSPQAKKKITNSLHLADTRRLSTEQAHR